MTAAAQLNIVTRPSPPEAPSAAAAGAGAVRMAGAGPAARFWVGWESLTVACGGSFWVGATWMRAVSFLGAALMVTGLASA